MNRSRAAGAALLFLALGSPFAHADDTTPPTPATETARRFYDAFIRSDFATMETLYAPSVKWRDAFCSANDRDHLMGIWRTELSQGAKIDYTLGTASAPDASGAVRVNVHWHALYRLLGNPVVNDVDSTLTIDRSGHIVDHRETFSWSRWAHQVFPSLGDAVDNPLMAGLLKGVLRTGINFKAAIEMQKAARAKEAAVRSEGLAASPATPAEQKAALDAVRRFYDAFAKSDFATMEKIYSPDVKWKDTIFSAKDREHLMGIWRFELAPSAGGKVTYEVLGATPDANGATKVKVRWRDVYSLFGNPIDHAIDATLTVDRDGKIVDHRETYSWSEWAHQAFPFLGDAVDNAFVRGALQIGLRGFVYGKTALDRLMGPAEPKAEPKADERRAISRTPGMAEALEGRVQGEAQRAQGVGAERP